MVLSKPENAHFIAGTSIIGPVELVNCSGVSVWVSAIFCIWLWSMRGFNDPPRPSLLQSMPLRSMQPSVRKALFAGNQWWWWGHRFASPSCLSLLLPAGAAGCLRAWATADSPLIWKWDFIQILFAQVSMWDCICHLKFQNLATGGISQTLSAPQLKARRFLCMCSCLFQSSQRWICRAKSVLSPGTACKYLPRSPWFSHPSAERLLNCVLRDHKEQFNGDILVLKWPRSRL